MKPIYIPALYNVRTGGPEATHQLSDALIEQGFDARLVYYDWEQMHTLEKSSVQDGYYFGARPNTIEEYTHYKANVVGSIPNIPDTVVVLSETLCHLAPKFNRCTVLIWWLSVDNAFASLARVNLNHLRASNVSHVWQSRYAEKFIRSLGFRDDGSLSDYTIDLAQYATPLPMSERPKLVLFNANQKVIADLQSIADSLGAIDPGIECIPIRGHISRKDMADLYAKARLYVDLGSFPGKDRGPREAASMGCIPLVLDAGAGGADFIDWSTDGYCLATRINREINEATQFNWAAQSVSERDTFNGEVLDIFTECSSSS